MQRRTKSPLPAERAKRDTIAESVNRKVGKRWAVLDIDSTLVHARDVDLTNELVHDSRNFYVRPITSQTVMRVTKRKYLEKFLNDLVEHGYTIVVWSAGAPSYVRNIVSVIFNGIPVEHVLTYDHLTGGRKILSNIDNYIPGFNHRDCRLIDDNSDHFKGQEELCIEVKPFFVQGFHLSEHEDDSHLENLIDIVNRSFA